MQFYIFRTIDGLKPILYNADKFNQFYEKLEELEITREFSYAFKFQLNLASKKTKVEPVIKDFIKIIDSDPVDDHIFGFIQNDKISVSDEKFDNLQEYELESIRYPEHEILDFYIDIVLKPNQAEGMGIYIKTDLLGSRPIPHEDSFIFTDDDFYADSIHHYVYDEEKEIYKLTNFQADSNITITVKGNLLNIYNHTLIYEGDIKLQLNEKHIEISFSNSGLFTKIYEYEKEM